MFLEDLLGAQGSLSGPARAALRHERASRRTWSSSTGASMARRSRGSPHGALRSACRARVLRLRARHDDRRRHGCAARTRRRARSASTRSTSRVETSRGGRAGVPRRGQAARRGGRHGRGHRADGRTSAQFHDAHGRRDAARRRRAAGHRPAILVSCRRVLDVPHAARARRGRDGAELTRSRTGNSSAGYILACQSRPTTAEIELDYDETVRHGLRERSRLAIEAGVARLTLNRPDRLNSFNVDDARRSARRAGAAVARRRARACWC